MGGSTVLVVGGGGREHSLCAGLYDSPLVSKIHCCPGNAGISAIAETHDISATDVDSIISLCCEVGVDLVVVGPEAPLCNFLADRLIEKGISCFGPIATLAELEGSKLHAKQVMAHVGVPTAEYLILDSASDIESALDSYDNNPWVIKRDVLAGGKGVVVTSDRTEAKEFIVNSIVNDGKVLLEQFLPGEEASMLVVMDGSGFVCLPASQDHKRAYDGDKGPNTGGMGAYCPAPVVTDEVKAKVIKTIVTPMFNYLSNQEIPYRGVLYVGLMITEDGEPNVVEYNVRFGDPECQITLPLIKTDLFEILNSASSDKLSSLDVEFHSAHAITIVLASEGYPSNPVAGKEITGAEVSLPQIGLNSAWVNHAGTKFENGILVSSGGRVLSCSAMAESLDMAKDLAYSLVESINLDNGHFRKDIGSKALGYSPE